MTCQGDCSCKNNEVPTTKSTTGNVEDDDIWSDDDSKLILQNDIIRSHYKKGYVDHLVDDASLKVNISI